MVRAALVLAAGLAALAGTEARKQKGKEGGMFGNIDMEKVKANMAKMDLDSPELAEELEKEFVTVLDGARSAALARDPRPAPLFFVWRAEDELPCLCPPALD